MGDKLEITLRVTLDRPGLERRLRQPIENDKAFFILGLVQAQLTRYFGQECCRVEMEAATGLTASLIGVMNDFARDHQRAIDSLHEQGEVIVDDADLADVLQLHHDVVVTPVGSRWRVARLGTSGSPVATSRAKVN